MKIAPRSDFEWLLDQVALVLASWKLVIIGTAILTAAGTAGMFWLSPPVYSSRMILPLTPSLQAMIGAGVIGETGITLAQLPPSSALYSVSMSARSAEEAEAGVKRTLEQILERSKPPASERTVLLSKLELLKSSLAAAEQGRQAAPLSLAVELQEKLMATQASLAGLSADQIVLHPTKAARSDSPRSRFASVLLASAALMVLFALLRPHVPQVRDRISSRFA